MKQAAITQDKLTELARILQQAAEIAQELGITTPFEKTKIVPYRIYSDAEINAFLENDRLPKTLAQKVRRSLSDK